MRIVFGNRHSLSGKIRIGVLLAASALAVLLANPRTFAQGAPPAAAANVTPPPVDQLPPALTSDQLDQLCAPIALYPDALLAQVLMASAYPLDVVAANRFMQKNSKLTADAMEQALDKQPWDVSVKTLTRFPSVLKYMDENLEATEALGNAFVNQQADVMASIQNLRSEAYAAGNLKTGPQQTVTMDSDNIVIAPTDGQTVYVPQYDPQVVYTQGPSTVVVTQPTTTVVTQPAYTSTDVVATGLLSFGAGMLMGSMINNNCCNWGGGYMYAPYGGNNNGWQHNGDTNINIGNGNGNGANRPWKPDNNRRPPSQNGRPGQVRPAARNFGYNNGPGRGASNLPANTRPGAGGGAFGGYSNGRDTLQSSTRGQQSLGGNNRPGGGTKPARPAQTRPAKPAGTPQRNFNQDGGAFGGGSANFNRSAGQRGGGSMNSAQRNGFKPPKRGGGGGRGGGGSRRR